MKKVALVIDNSSYLNEEDLATIKPVKVLPISFIVNGEEYYENVNMSYGQFFDFLSDKNTTVSTSQPSIESVKEEWREILKEYDELGKVPLFGSIALINNAFADWIADDNKDMKEGNEQRPVGPMMSLENGVVVWYNDRCLMYCYMRDDSKEREEEMIKTLEMKEW